MSEESFKEARINMVRNQLVPSQIWDEKLLDAMSEVPRHLFVDDKWGEVAYVDGCLPASEHRKVLKPLLFAKMVDACKITTNCKVLDIACGLGYSSAVLSRIAETVIGIENNIELINRAKHLASQLEIRNCYFSSRELIDYFAEDSFFDVIFINGALHKTPSLFFEQLNNAKGRMILLEPCGEINKVVLYSKSHKGLSRQELFSADAEFLH